MSSNKRIPENFFFFTQKEQILLLRTLLKFGSFGKNISKRINENMLFFLLRKQTV